MKSKIINLNSNNIKIITRSLLIGKTIVIPTDTVYGIAADAKSFQGVENIFKIKKRPKRFPLILFTHSIAEAKKLAIFSPFEEYLASKYWPGPLTLILKKKGKKFYNGDKRLSKVGIRIPKNKDVIKILEYIQKPLATTSANIHGEINIKSLNQLGIIKSKDVAYAIEKKGKMSFKESTLVETKNNQINIIREGSLSKKSPLKGWTSCIKKEGKIYKSPTLGLNVSRCLTSGGLFLGIETRPSKNDIKPAKSFSLFNLIDEGIFK